jgi:hypothetical protein
MVWERPGDRVLAILRADAAVDAGGLYTTGADRYIFGAAFDEIVAQLKSWTEGRTEER